jgi:hypothetical protein
LKKAAQAAQIEPTEAELAAASVAEDAARAAGMTAPVDSAEQSDLPMAPGRR